MPSLTLDYRTAFDLAPIGLVLSRQRQIVDCNQLLLAMFGAQRNQLLGRSFEVLYPTAMEFERTGERIIASLDAQGHYADERVRFGVVSGHDRKTLSLLRQCCLAT